MRLLVRIEHKFAKLRFQPIRVFCLHHVSDAFDITSMCEGDWMEISTFKNRVWQMQRDGYTFISLEDAYCKIQKDFVRCHKYAVITFDDGYKSLDEILPWLIEQKIPVTLFINGNYTDGKSQRQVEGKHFSYLTKDELKHYVEISKGLISLQSHGYEHLDATSMSLDDFREQIEMNMSLLTSICQPSISLAPHGENNGGGGNQPLPIMGETEEGASHAYTWGRHNATTDAILREHNIIPVYMDGMKNYNDASCIHRELLE